MPDKSQPPQPDILRHSKPPRLKAAGIAILCLAIAVVVIGGALRFYNNSRTKAWTDDQLVPTVQTITLHGAKAGADMTLPGDVQAFVNAPIYAQVSGVVQKWFVDIGGKVKAGDVLAQIDPRSYQAALDQARGQLARDSATLANAKVDLGRYQSLAAQSAISGQQLATQNATVGADSGLVESDRANVQTATINLGYTKIVAPFSGTVTSRAVDVGNLVTVGTASATPLFTVTDQHRLRIYVHVPQSALGMFKPGMTARFTVPEYPGRSFTAQLAASAGAVASASGTQLVQFQTDNSDGALKPGDYAEMHITPPAGGGAIRVPATALMFRDAGMMVATVGPGDHVHLKPIHIQTDLGTAVDVGSGLSLKDRVIDNPPDSIQEGDPVHVLAPAAK